jgi:hypothetical protein
MAVEFRCASWLAQGSGDESARIPAANCTPGALMPSYVKEDVMAWLRRNNMAFVVVDEYLEEWPNDDDHDHVIDHPRSVTPPTRATKPPGPRGGPAPTFMSSHSLLSSTTSPAPSSSSYSSSSPSSSSSSSSSSSTTTPAAATPAAATSPVAALGFQLYSRLRRHRSDDDQHRDSDNGGGDRPPRREAYESGPVQQRATAAAAATTSSPPRPPQGVQAAKNEWRRQQGAVERKVRMVPIVERVTHPSVCYVRIHRRRGNDKLLTPAELDAWAARLRRLGRLLGGQGRIYVMMNTNFEDQGIQNAVNLAQRLPDLGTTRPQCVSCRVVCGVCRVVR